MSADTRDVITAMSPTAVLIGREYVTNTTHQSLTSTVERLLSTSIDNTETFSVNANRKHQLIIARISKPDRYSKPQAKDEGFESDIDSVSLISSDGDSVNCVSVVKQISDSANCSGASDTSDTETNHRLDKTIESFNLDDVVCYTNVLFPKIIGFVVKKELSKNELIVFEFDSIDHYDRLRYAFNTITAAAINKNVVRPSSSNRFHLVQRTDKCGVTHIEISRDSETDEQCSIVSITTQDTDGRTSRFSESRLSRLSKNKSTSQADLFNEKPRLNSTERHPNNFETLRLKARSNSHTDLLTDKSFKISFSRSNSFADLLNEPQKIEKKVSPEIDCIIRADVEEENKKIHNVNIPVFKNEDTVLRKVWRSAENILDEDTNTSQPKKPERRKKIKGKAPQPPNVLKGQYVRVAVDPNKRLDPKQALKLATFEANKIEKYNSNWVYVASQPSSMVLTTVVSTPVVYQKPSYDSFKSNSTSEFRTESIDHRAFTMNRKGRESRPVDQQKWVNSVQRTAKMPRSRSENRYTNKNNVYKFVDPSVTPVSYVYPTMNQNINPTLNPNGVPNRFKNILAQNQYNSNQNNFTNTYNLTNQSSISNRLFGLSQKLKEFGTNVVSTNHKFGYDNNQQRRGSLGELTHKSTTFATRYGSGNERSSNTNLKSVIKKQNDDRKMKNSNEKKVTFSAFATVQVV